LKLGVKGEKNTFASGDFDFIDLVFSGFQKKAAKVFTGVSVAYARLGRSFFKRRLLLLVTAAIKKRWEHSFPPAEFNGVLFSGPLLLVAALRQAGRRTMHV
jgi:hypothetical protein